MVARRVDYGEADRICTLLTASLGKVSVLARSARRSRKRFGGALSLFVIGKATVKEPARGDLHLLERFDSIEDLGPGIASDVVKMAHGSYILEVTRELWPAAQPEPECFELVCEALRVLASQQSASPSLLRAFELKLLSAVGLEPSLDRCVRCGSDRLGDPLVYNVHQGGLICAACGPQGWPMSLEIQGALLRARDMPLDEAAGTSQPQQVARQMRDLMLLTMRHHLGKELRSLEFLIQLSGSSTRSPG